MTIERTMAQARHDGFKGGAYVSSEFDDGSIFDLLAYEEERRAEAEAQVREHYAPLCDAETAAWQ